MTYVVSLKWKMAEYQALFRLQSDIKDQIFPLITIPPIDYDFEDKKDKKTPQEHLEKFPARYSAKWNGRPSMIDFHESLHGEKMDNGVSTIQFVFDGLRAGGQLAIPVTGLGRTQEYEDLIKDAQEVSSSGIGLRVTLLDLMKPDCSSRIESLLTFHGLSKGDVDLIVDLSIPDTFEPYDLFATAIVERLKLIRNLESFRTFIFLSGSINIQGVNRPGKDLPRHEWLLYQIVREKISAISIPVFGDYCTESPLFPEPMDMRMVKPAAKIFYTCESHWKFIKGKALRGNKAQLVDLCKEIVDSSDFQGAQYSWADKKIDDTARKVIEPSGSSTPWKQVGFNHHMTFIVRQLSSHDAA